MLTETKNTKPSPAEQDHVIEVVPLNERRGPITLGLLWITMVTGFPTVFIGFEWYKAQLTLFQVIECVAISGLLLLAYSIPATYLGSKSGQTYSVLSRRVFGAWGSRLVSINIVWMFIVWYGWTAMFIAEGLKGVCHIGMPTMWLASAFAITMALNNLFGFKGIANFAKYLAAPVLIACVGYTFFKASAECPHTVFAMPIHQTFPQALSLVATFVLGYGVWGIEADFWRYGKPEKMFSAIPLLCALLIGLVLFPITGWLLAYISGITESGAATNLVYQYAFGGRALFIEIVLFVTCFAMNDSNLYASINALENLKEMPHRKVVTALAVVGAIAAAWLANNPKAFELAVTLNGIFMPAPTVIMVAEYFWFKPIHEKNAKLEYIPSFSELPAVQWSAVVALICGIAVGVMTAGIVPGLDGLKGGICSLQAWLVSGVVYCILRSLEFKRMAERRVQLENSLQEDPLGAPQFVELD